MNDGEIKKYLVGVFPACNFPTGEFSEVKTALEINVHFSKDGGLLGPNIFEAACYPFEKGARIGGAVVSHAQDELILVNDILRYLVQNGIVRGEYIKLSPEELNNCLDLE